MKNYRSCLGITLVEVLIIVTVVSILAAISIPIFSKYARARNLGGSMVVNLPNGHKLVNATWKENQLWYLVRPMRSGEVPEVSKFLEKSVAGLFQGKIIFKESNDLLPEAPAQSR